MKTLRLPQGSTEWLNARNGVITGTKGKKAVGSNNLDLIDELIADPYTEEDDFVSKAMQWGKDLEPEARQTYTNATGIKINEFGFCKHDTIEELGISPDGYTEDLSGGIEIKCPNTKTHVKYLRMDKVPTDYIYQVYHNFLINERLEWLDFVSYDPRFIPCQMFIKRITREEIQEELAEYSSKLMKFIIKYNNHKNTITL